MPRPPHSPWFDLPNNIWWWVQIMNMLGKPWIFSISRLKNPVSNNPCVSSGQRYLQRPPPRLTWDCNRLLGPSGWVLWEQWAVQLLPGQQLEAFKFWQRRRHSTRRSSCLTNSLLFLCGDTVNPSATLVCR
jgi:hypothetical protein